jgi:hypothetical protein
MVDSDVQNELINPVFAAFLRPLEIEFTTCSAIKSSKPPGNLAGQASCRSMLKPMSPSASERAENEKLAELGRPDLFAKQIRIHP